MICVLNRLSERVRNCSPWLVLLQGCELSTRSLAVLAALIDDSFVQRLTIDFNKLPVGSGLLASFFSSLLFSLPFLFVFVCV